jgi:very-short-patch-repair endonuclease
MKNVRIIKYNLDGEFVEIFDSVKAASDSVGLSSHSGIVACCKQKPNANTTGGFQWRYYSEEYPLNIGRPPKRGETFKKIYGVGTDGHSSIQNKKKKTSIENYGYEHPMKSQEVKRSYEKTCLLKYGVRNVANNDEIKLKISKSERERKSAEYIEKNIYGDLNLVSLNSLDQFEILSSSCNHQFNINRQLLTIRRRNSHVVCTICNPPDKNQKSEIENTLKSEIDKICDNIETNIRNLTDRKIELDIYLKDYKIGIEVNGSKFHSEEYGKGINYHLDKTNLFNSFGIRVFHFYDDEIENKMDIILSMIKNSTGKSKKIWARKCKVEKITNKESLIFLEKNHMQGGVNSEYCYALKYENEIVSVMTFGRVRKILGYSNSENEYELLRFSNLLGISVVGGASRLMKKFISDVSPEKIITYANRRWSEGNLYEKIGFSFSGFTNPGYDFFYKNKRVSRHKLRRVELIKMGFSPDKKTQEILDEISAYRIWDCGNYKFIWQKKTSE